MAIQEIRGSPSRAGRIGEFGQPVLEAPQTTASPNGLIRSHKILEGGFNWLKLDKRYGVMGNGRDCEYIKKLPGEKSPNKSLLARMDSFSDLVAYLVG
jgi:hypothetical protein